MTVILSFRISIVWWRIVFPRKGILRRTAFSREEFAEHMMENPADFYYGVLWNKLYRRDLVEKYHLSMDTDVNWCEDFLFNLEYILHANVFYALQVPIYYYVKRKGSLASQGMSISKTIKMKFMVFEYYNNFYKNLYDEKDYEKKRLSVYRFFVDAAGDGAVPPALLPGVFKLRGRARDHQFRCRGKRGFWQRRTRPASCWSAIWRQPRSAMT